MCISSNYSVHQAQTSSMHGGHAISKGGVQSLLPQATTLPPLQSAAKDFAFEKIFVTLQLASFESALLVSPPPAPPQLSNPPSFSVHQAQTSSMHGGHAISNRRSTRAVAPGHDLAPAAERCKRALTRNNLCDAAVGELRVSLACVSTTCATPAEQSSKLLSPSSTNKLDAWWACHIQKGGVL